MTDMGLGQSKCRLCDGTGRTNSAREAKMHPERYEGISSLAVIDIQCPDCGGTGKANPPRSSDD